ncbi:MAG: 50S ribosomal protein L28 [Candidatus Doudnabacteria bacterium]|nr:50S ribosomal protein L28 [Candidatus Doudnabacteria bacterium]MCA9387440.1 50S ribosomal protein L28 [Candidatus Andersenbacteria bacterium]
MSRRCDNCDRKPNNLVSRSKSNIATKRRQHLNIQTKRVDGKKMKLCVSCLKAQAKS